MSDRLTLTRALEGSGMASDAAERIATEIYDAMHDNVATKSDLDRLEVSTKTEFAAVRADTRELEQRLTLRFEQVERQIDDTVTRLGALVVVVATLLFGALHYWPRIEAAAMAHWSTQHERGGFAVHYAALGGCDVHWQRLVVAGAAGWSRHRRRSRCERRRSARARRSGSPDTPAPPLSTQRGRRLSTALQHCSERGYARACKWIEAQRPDGRGLKEEN